MVRSSLSHSSYFRPLLAFVLIGGILYVAKAFIVPLALAILLTFVLTPVVMAIQRRGVPRVPAVLLTVVFTFAVFGAAGWVVGIQVQRLAHELPRHRHAIDEKIASLRASGTGPFSNFLQMLRELARGQSKSEAAAEKSAPKERVVVVQPDEASSGQQLLQSAEPVLEPLAQAGLVVILVIFMLIRREDLRNRVIGLLGHGRLTGTTRVVVDATQRLSRFLLAQLLTNVGIGVLFATGLLILGVPYAFLWGFLMTVLRFVPYIGSWVAAAMPLLVSFATAPGFTQPLLVLVLFLVLDTVTANVIEPLLFGHGTGVSPIALLVAASFWTWIWGPIGLVLSTPMTVCLVSLGQHVRRLRFFALLLGDKPALAPHASFYQRLLARDSEEASQVVAEYAGAEGLPRAYDDVLLPALMLTRRHREKGDITPEDEAYVLESTRNIVNGLPSAAPAETGDSTPASAVLVVGCPAHHEVEELCLAMLGRVVKSDGFEVRVESTRVLPTEVEAEIEREKPALVFVAVMPPGGLVQARYLCRLLRQRFADLPIIVGYWGNVRQYDRLLVRLRKAGASYVTTSLLQTRSQMQALAKTAERPAPNEMASSS